MKKHLANIITSIRIVLAIVLLFFSTFNLAFFILFIIAGLTDLLDGPIARICNSTSVFGSVLDTIGDFLLTTATFKIFVKTKYLKRAHIILIISLIGVALIIPLIGYIKFRTIYFPHSLFSKFLGGATFLLPFAALTDFVYVAIYGALAIFVFYIIEAMLIQILAKTPSPDALFITDVIKCQKKDTFQKEELNE